MGTHSLSSLLRAPEGLSCGAAHRQAQGHLHPQKIRAGGSLGGTWHCRSQPSLGLDLLLPGCATLDKSPNLSVPSPSVGVIPGIERLAEVTLHISRNWEACIAEEPGTRGGERGTWGHKAEFVQSHTALSTLAVGDSGEGTVLKIFSVPGWKKQGQLWPGLWGEK